MSDCTFRAGTMKELNISLERTARFPSDYSDQSFHPRTQITAQKMRMQRTWPLCMYTCIYIHTYMISATAAICIVSSCCYKLWRGIILACRMRITVYSSPVCHTMYASLLSSTAYYILQIRACVHACRFARMHACVSTHIHGHMYRWYTRARRGTCSQIQRNEYPANLRHDTCTNRLNVFCMYVCICIYYIYIYTRMRACMHGCFSPYAAHEHMCTCTHIIRTHLRSYINTTSWQNVLFPERKTDVLTIWRKKKERSKECLSRKVACMKVRCSSCMKCRYACMHVFNMNSSTNTRHIDEYEMCISMFDDMFMRVKPNTSVACTCNYCMHICERTWICMCMITSVCSVYEYSTPTYVCPQTYRKKNVYKRGMCAKHASSLGALLY